MIEFINNNNKEPYKLLRKLYKKALNMKQKNIEAFLIASYSSSSDEVDSRFVNLKYVDDESFIFFSNYNSPKAKQFSEHQQISTVLYWNQVNIQIRIKGYIKKASKEFNINYFKNRSKDKNAIAIGSQQSDRIASYKKVKDKYKNTLNRTDLDICPEYWGGFILDPFYFEFWEGNDSRINKRQAYELKDSQWISYFLEP